MNRTAFVEELKQMRFEAAYEGYHTKHLSQEAASLLGVSSRRFRRYINHYEESGLAGLCAKRLITLSVWRTSVGEAMALTVYSCRYNGWNVRRFHRWYQQKHHGLR